MKINIKNNNNNNQKGVSLIEILVVLTVFAVLGVLSTRVILLSLQGSKKGDSQIKVRENLDYAVSVIERQLRNASNITPCPNIDTTLITYVDYNDTQTTFSCEDIGEEGYIASGSARLTGEDVAVTSCSFVCTPATGTNPPNISIDVAGVDASSQGAKEGGSVTITTEINLRTY